MKNGRRSWHMHLGTHLQSPRRDRRGDANKGPRVAQHDRGAIHECFDRRLLAAFAFSPISTGRLVLPQLESARKRISASLAVRSPMTTQATKRWRGQPLGVLDPVFSLQLLQVKIVVDPLH